MTKRISRKALALAAVGVLASPALAQVANAQIITKTIAVTLKAVGPIPSGVTGASVTVTCKNTTNNPGETVSAFSLTPGQTANLNNFLLTTAAPGSSCKVKVVNAGSANTTLGATIVSIGGAASTATSGAYKAGSGGTVETDYVAVTDSTDVQITMSFPQITVKKVVVGDEATAGFAYPMSIACSNPGPSAFVSPANGLEAGGAGGFVTVPVATAAIPAARAFIARNASPDIWTYSYTQSNGIVVSNVKLGVAPDLGPGGTQVLPQPTFTAAFAASVTNVSAFISTPAAPATGGGYVGGDLSVPGGGYLEYATTNGAGVKTPATAVQPTQPALPAAQFPAVSYTTNTYRFLDALTPQSVADGLNTIASLQSGVLYIVASNANLAATSVSLPANYDIPAVTASAPGVSPVVVAAAAIPVPAPTPATAFDPQVLTSFTGPASATNPAVAFSLPTFAPAPTPLPTGDAAGTRFDFKPGTKYTMPATQWLRSVVNTAPLVAGTAAGTALIKIYDYRTSPASIVAPDQLGNWANLGTGSPSTLYTLVVKSINDGAPGQPTPNTAGGFNGTFALKGGESKSFSFNEFPNLSTASKCEIWETNGGGATVTGFSSTNGTAAPLGGVTNSAGRWQSNLTGMNETITVTNSFLGDMIISKVVTGDPKTNIATYEISVACDKGGPKDTFLIKDRQSKVYSGIASGTNCLITETKSDGAVASYKDNSGDNTTDGRVTIKRRPIGGCGDVLGVTGAPTAATPGGPAPTTTFNECWASVIITNDYNPVAAPETTKAAAAAPATAAPATAAPAIAPAPATPVDATPTFAG
jgi:Domain of unknown function (DUF5979)